MRKIFTLWAAAGAFFTSTVYAQTLPHRGCGTLEATAELQKADPGLKARMQQNEVATARFLSNPANNSKIMATKTIPVVFHVVYNTTAQNISAAQLQSQLDVLNTDFRRMNPDTVNTPAGFIGTGADTQIEFCLASVDPTGLPTTGITRTSTTVTSFSVNSPNQVKTTSLGGKDPWPRDQYLNIWVCNMGGGILGYATPPGSSPASDGLVLLYSGVGKPPYNNFPAPYNLGRTATHEVGHWLNLIHIWGDEAGCAADDQVADTPLQKAENYGCPIYPLVTGTGASCSGVAPGAMFMNYMDYTDDACMYMFTKGQRDRMVACLNTTRAAILTSTACQNTLAANFGASATTVVAGNTVNFTSLSTGSPTSYSWSFGGGTPTTSTVQNPSNILYSTPGSYPVSLTVSNGTASNTKTIASYITVINTSNCSDTLNRPFPGTPTIYVSQNSTGVKNGYVSGNNGYGDKAKAEKFTTGGTIKGGLFGFGRAKAASPASSVTFAVWDNTGTGGKPGAVVASKVVPISTIISNMAANQLTSVTFTSPVTVSSGYYMGVILSNTPGDTVALITNTHSASAPVDKGWEQDATNVWGSYSADWGLNISNAIFPIVEATAPVVNFTPATSTICAGSTVTFNSSTTTGATSFTWSFPGGTPSTSTVANPTVTYSTPGTYSVSLTGRSNSCNLTTTLNKPNAVTVGTAPTVTVNPGNSINCSPTAVTLTATGATTYTWSPATGLSATTGGTVTANPATTTTYTVIGTTNGCSSPPVSVPVVVVNTTANFTTNPAIVDLKTLPSGQVTFTNTSTNAIFYTWNFGVPSAGAANTSTATTPPPFSYTTPGTYTVTLTANSPLNGGCNNVKTFDILVKNTTGLSEAFDNGSIKIYPNPAKNYLQVEVPERENVTEVQLTNAIGQIVCSEKPTAGQTRLNVHNLAGGIYFVKIINAEGSITKKISILQ